MSDTISAADQDARADAAATAGTARPLSEAELWEAFVGSERSPDLLAAWLALQCAEVRDVAAAALLLPRADGAFGPAAVWPDQLTDVTHLAAVAERAVTERTVALVPADDGKGARLLVACPLEGRSELRAVIVLDAAARTGAELSTMLRRLQWGSGWVEAFLSQSSAAQAAERLRSAALALETLAVVNEYDALDGAALALVNELAQRFNCDRVALGMVRGHVVRLRAISHAAWFQERADLVAAIENAMEEAYDQSAAVVLPPLPDTEGRISIAHDDMMRLWKATSVASVVIRPRGEIIGVLTFERVAGEPFDRDAVAAMELLGSTIGPTLKMKAEAERLLSGRIVERFRQSLRALFGPRHPGIKLAAILGTVAVAVPLLWQGEFRVTAKSVLEGAVQRAAVAPFQAFIHEAPAKAGDIVTAGQLLARLDDRDLRSEVIKWESERQKSIQRERDALAKHDRPGSLIAAAQQRQAEAELALATEKLGRTRIVAPIDGLVVSGDLSQLIGTPVEQGKVLFEVAPLNAYRVVLQVSEFDIGHVVKGQSGIVALTGSTGVTVPFSVERITPVTSQQNGRNVFRVEGLLGPSEVALRPGMEGVAKVSVGRASLAWIWLRGVFDRVRVAVWEWTP